MLLSFKPEVYEKIKSGKKIFEHRRNFPDEPIMAYMYVSAPVKAITGIVYLGKRHLLSDWHEEFKDDKDAVARIEQYEKSYRYAMEIMEFQETTNIPLDEWRATISDYAVTKNNDGEYIYDETIAEAFHDCYLNGSNAKPASRMIMKVLNTKLSDHLPIVIYK